MKTIILTLLAMATLALAIPAAQAGNCTYPWETASDGSRCGDRAATIRPGGGR